MPRQQEAASPASPRREHRSTARTWRSRLIAAVLAAGLATALPATAGAAATAAPAARTVPPAALPHGATDVGSLDGSTPLDLTVTLEPRDPAALDSFVAAVTTPGSASYRRYLAPGEFGARFGADPSTVARVTDELKAAGLHPGAPDANMLSIPVEATAADASAAFGTRFSRTRLADGRVGHRHTTAATVPAGAAGIVGLDNWPRSRHDTPTSRDSAASLSGACPTGGSLPGTWSASQLAAAYGLSSVGGVNGGSGQTVALYELSDYADGDVAAFQNCLGMRPSVTRVKVDGGTSDTSGAGEVMLDADIVMSLAPNASILVYVAPNTASGALDEYRAIVNDDRAQVVSVSWGLCEADEGSADARAENNLFKQAAAQGQSVFAASGDDGSADCYGADGSTGLAVDDPASQPFVTGVGGTTLSSVAPRQESVWNSYGSGGGGGVSQLWSLPAYQSTAHVPASSPCGATGGCRQVPDVSASADPYHGYSVYCSIRNACGSGGWLAFGGTSGAAPLWAAASALLNEACGPARRIGFANPALYAAAGALHDVTTGNNDALGVNGGAYAAAAGYDLATGLGTPDVAALAGVLCAGPTTTTPIATSPVPTSPVAAVSPLTATFGAATVGGSAPAATFTVANTGTAALSVSAVTVSGADATDFPVAGDTCTANTVPALGACTVQVAFRPSVARLEAATLTVTSDSAPPALPVALVGTGTAPAVDPPMTTAATPAGYWMVTADGHVHPFGDAVFYGDAADALAPLMAAGVRATKLEPTPTGHGYWIVDSAGQVAAFGDAHPVGGVTAGELRRGERVSSLSTTPSGDGYWLFTDQGRVFPFGDAPFLGDMSTTRLNGPIFGSIPTTTGRGYYLVGSDGGIFAFGDATFRGSMGGTHLNAPVESLVPAADGGGYWLVAGDGGIFDFSDRPFLGSLAGTSLPQPVVAVGSLDH